LIKLIFLGTEDVSARIEISKFFQDIGYEIEIIGTEKEDKFLKNNIKYRKYNLNRELNIIDDIKTIFELRKLLKSFPNNTIIHAFDTKPTMYLPIASIGLKNIKVVRTITGMGRIFSEDNIKNKILRSIYNIIQKTISKNIDFTIFQNEDDYNYFIKNKLISPEKGEIVKSSGLNIEKFELLCREEVQKKDKTTFILISRIVKEKGILYYLEAAKICYEKGYDYNFLLVGQLDTDGSITKEILDSYSKYVNYLGRREDVPKLLKQSDVFVLPTYYREGVPRVLLEASACGKAIITTNMPGCKDVVIDEYNGKLVNIKDSKDLSDKMIYLGENKDKIEKFGQNAKKKVKEFDIRKVVSKYNIIYRRVLKD